MEFPSSYIGIVGGVLLVYAAVAFVSYYEYKFIKILVNCLFVISILGETAITIRGQFSTTLQHKIELAIGALMTSLVIITVTMMDIYYSLLNHMPMQGRRKLIRVPGHPPILAGGKWYEKIVNLFIIVSHTLKHSSWEDKVRIGASIAQFALRLAEFLSRLLCKVRACKILSNSISAVPILLAVLCFAKRFLRKVDPPHDHTVSCILVGDYQRRAGVIEAPYSDLWAQSMNHMIATVSRTFDIWSSRFSSTSGENWHFTMMEMRLPEIVPENEVWYFPPADFLILHFSVTNRASYDAINDTWIPFVNDHNTKSRIVMIGTHSGGRGDNDVTEAEGYALAYAANAISYFELENFEQTNVSKLFSEIVELLV